MIGLYMAVFMLFIGWSSPAGVLLYWDVSSILGVAQQQFTQAAVKKSLGDQEELVEEAMELADGEAPKKKKTPKSNKKK
jgi:YidC/Oxa1 family membrane protein insertase